MRVAPILILSVILILCFSGCNTSGRITHCPNLQQQRKTLVFAVKHPKGHSTANHTRKKDKQPVAKTTEENMLIPEVSTQNATSLDFPLLLLAMAYLSEMPTHLSETDSAIKSPAQKYAERMRKDNLPPVNDADSIAYKSPSQRYAERMRRDESVPEESRNADTAVITGAVSIVTLFFFPLAVALAITAVILGVKGLKSKQRWRKALAGLILGAITLAILLALFLTAIVILIMLLVSGL